MRIPLRSAKHHFGAHCTRGTRPYNEDAYQAGTIEIPAFAKRAPVSVTGRRRRPPPQPGSSGADEGNDEGPADGTGVAADSASGDPQVFYFGVFDGHGGDQCSSFLKEKLHEYVEGAAGEFGLGSSLHAMPLDRRKEGEGEGEGDASARTGGKAGKTPRELAAGMVNSWKETVGGYFRRFQPEHFPEAAGGLGKTLTPWVVKNARVEPDPTASNQPSTSTNPENPASSQGDATIEQVLTYAFLSADFDFVSAQTRSTTMQDESPLPGERKRSRPGPDADSAASSTEPARPEALGRHAHHTNPPPFLGGSTASTLLISTPHPTPFWHPSSPLTLITAHLGDTRILLCATSTGAAVPLTATHHPSTPSEAARLRRYAAAFTTDSFGEERFAGSLANTRAVGDVRQKRVGVSAEPDLRLLHLRPGEAAFVVLVSDGVSGVLSDQEIVDVVKEARTPEQGARELVGLAEELGVGERGEGDNATGLVVRLGGWERRSEGGGGGMGTREAREWRRREAGDPRKGRM